MSEYASVSWNNLTFEDSNKLKIYERSIQMYLELYLILAGLKLEHPIPDDGIFMLYLLLTFTRGKYLPLCHRHW
jgi:hypothetical protein